jgi:hypothetical protein
MLDLRAIGRRVLSPEQRTQRVLTLLSRELGNLSIDSRDKLQAVVTKELRTAIVDAMMICSQVCKERAADHQKTISHHGQSHHCLYEMSREARKIASILEDLAAVT